MAALLHCCIAVSHTHSRESRVLSLPLTESDTLDLKRDWSSPQGCLQALAAFANTHGGTLILGVEDDGHTVRGFDPSDSEELRIVSSVVDLLRITPEARRLPAPDGQRVFSLTVRPSPTLVRCQGRYLTRVGASNRDMTPEEIARRSLDVSGQSWDSLSGGTSFGLDGAPLSHCAGDLLESERLPPAPRLAQ
jgi:predicted HTH transcriptional regulator